MLNPSLAEYRVSTKDQKGKQPSQWLNLSFKVGEVLREKHNKNAYHDPTFRNWIYI